MPKKSKSKSAVKKSTSRKPAKKTAKKKAIKKKSSVKKVMKKKSVKKKATTKKKSLKKKTLKKTVKKKASAKTSPRRKQARPRKPLLVAPGPPPRGIPSVEEPASNEEAIGTVVHYYSHLSVAVIQINKGKLKTGDTVHIKGHSTDFVQNVESMEYEHARIDQVLPGQSVGILVKDHAREHDILYLVK
jgi:hypothetical protein